MEITHEEARKLIQHNADEALNQNQRITLQSHLDSCANCRAYATKLRETENTLRRLMHRQWDLHPTPLSMNVLASKRNFTRELGILLTTRKALVSIAIMVFIFGLWQFRLTDSKIPGEAQLSILPVPTPSAQLTRTKIMLQNCEEIRYKVQEHDTLESIADQFSTSKESIMTTNDMQTEAISPAMELIILICDSTPTGTANPPALTTYTPSTGLIATTPNG